MEQHPLKILRVTFGGPFHGEDSGVRVCRVIGDLRLCYRERSEEVRQRRGPQVP